MTCSILVFAIVTPQNAQMQNHSDSAGFFLSQKEQSDSFLYYYRNVEGNLAIMDWMGFLGKGIEATQSFSIFFVNFGY